MPRGFLSTSFIVRAMLERFPYEIFKRVIQFSNVFQPFSLFGNLAITLPPINASHVCRSWRTILLSDPTMWTCIRIPQMSPDGINEMLHRSRSAILELYIEPFDYFSRLEAFKAHLSSVLSSVFQEMHRFRILRINIPFEGVADGLLDQIFPYLQQPAPMLQTFCFDVQGKERAAGKKFLQTLFSGRAPNLRHVNLPVYVGFPKLRSSPLLRNLSDFHLDLRVEAAISGDILLDILELSPCLRVFRLGWVKPNPTVVFPISSDRQVCLPHLQQLDLAGDSDLANLILGHVVFPVEDVFYSITFADLNPENFDTTPLMRFLARCRLTFLSLYPLQDEVFLEFLERYSCTGSNSTFAAGYNNIYNPAENLPKFLQNFELSNIKHLCLMFDRWEYTTLRSIFVMLVNLNHLRVYDSDSGQSLGDYSLRTSFLRALIPHHSNPPAQAGLDQEMADKTHPNQEKASVQSELGPWYTHPSEHMFPCPSLSKLDIDIGDPEKLDEQYAQLLSVCSYIRHQAGRPFKSITIRCSKKHVTEEAMTWLKPHQGFPVTVQY